jgi:hypothetical protein
MKTIKAYKVVAKGNKKYYSWSYPSSNIVRYYTDGRWVTPNKNCNQFLFACPTLKAVKYWMVGLNWKTYQVFEVEIPENDLYKRWTTQEGYNMENNPGRLLCSQMRLIRKIKLKPYEKYKS